MFKRFKLETNVKNKNYYNERVRHISIKSLYIKCVRESKINKSQGKKKEKGIKYKLDIPLSLKIKTLRPTIFL